MRKKSFSLCHHFGCMRPTWSGKSERDPALRHCAYHSPIAEGIRSDFTKKARAAAETRKSTEKVSKIRFAAPLVCVYKEHEAVTSANGEVLRVVFLKDICGEKAPRRHRNKNEPRYPNRFGEPLCLSHAVWADDAHAFPGPEELLSSLEDERVEEHDARLARIVGQMPVMQGPRQRETSDV